MKGRLQGKAAFITGAASGMGRASSLLFLQEGASVTAFDRDEAGLTSLADEAGGLAERLLTLSGDVTSETDVSAAIERAYQRFERLDVLYPNAGVLWRHVDKSVVDTAVEDWDRVVSINLKGVFLSCKHGIPKIQAGKRGGSVILVGSLCARAGSLPAQDAYNCTKGAMIALAHSLGVQFARERIRANVIHPGMIATSMQAGKLEQEGWLDAVEAGIPMGRMGTAEEVARVALFLASDDSAYMTGSELIVDGGYLAQ